MWEDIQSQTRVLGIEPQLFTVREPDELLSAFAAMRRTADAVDVSGDMILNAARRQISALAVEHGLPTMGYSREYPKAGALISYGPNDAEKTRRSVALVDKVLKGAKPADLPVEQPNRFELVINLKTAKALGLTIPPSLLTRADEVIE